MNLTKEQSELVDRQNAGLKVEKRMMEFLTQLGAADDLKMADVKYIAAFARTVAYDEFSPKTGP